MLGMDRTLEIGSGFGAYFHGRIFRGILSEIESGQTSVTSSHEMDDAIDRVMARDGFAYKFGISDVSVGVGAKGDFDEEHLVALPPERFMPTLTKDNGWQAFNQIIAEKFRNNPLDMSVGAEYKSLYSHTELKTTGGWLGMVPVNLNHVDNPNLGQDVASGRVDMEYYLVYYDKVKDRVIYPTDKNGDYYIINMKDAERAEEIRLKLSEDTFIQQKDK